METLQFGGKTAILGIGGPASGGSTQLQKLSQVLPSFTLLSTGERFRELGRMREDIARLVSKGELVPDRETNTIVLNELTDLKHPNVIFDKTIRTLVQAVVQTAALIKHDYRRLVVLYFDIPEQIMDERSNGRQRTDDKPEVFKRRKENYFGHLADLLDFFYLLAGTHGGFQVNIIRVDSSYSIEEVTRKMFDGLKEITAVAFAAH